MLYTPHYHVFTGCKIYTMSDACPEAEAICVEQGRIACLGSREEVIAFARQGSYELTDFGGGVLYPGFIDTHSHLSLYAAWIQYTHCGTQLGAIQTVLERLREQASRDPAAEWILGYGYDDTGISDKRHLNRHDLDAVCADRPVLVQHISSHFCYVNSLGLQKLGMKADTQIAGGTVHLGADGQPDGLLAENAAFVGMAALPTPTLVRQCANMEQALQEYARQGITTFQDGGIGISGAENSATVLQAYAHLARAGKLPIRAYLHLMEGMLDKVRPLGLWGLQTDYLALGGLKCFIDGSIQGFTAALKQPYHSRPDWKGEILMPTQAIDDLIRTHHCNGEQIAIHCNGDAAIELALQAFAKALSACPNPAPYPLRHMIIHAQTASDAHLEQMQRLGIIPSFFSRHIEVWGDRHHDIFLGPERAARLNPAGTCERLGMPFSLHVDTPVLPVTVLQSMHAAVNRISAEGRLLGAEQRISPRAALQAYTTHAALCCAGEQDRGCLEPGRWADFVLLSDDILGVAPENINKLQVRKTICGGRVVYEA